MTQVGPVPGGDPVTVLWAWRQAHLEQAAHERMAGAGRRPAPRHGAGPRGTDADADPHADPSADAPADGPKPGEHSYLYSLRTVLLESLTRVGTREVTVRRMLDRLAATPPELRTLLHPTALADPDALGNGVLWLVEHLDRPNVAAAACGRLGPAVEAVLGPRQQHLEAFGLAMLEALRLAVGPDWRPEYAAAWRSMLKFAVQWLRHGMALTEASPSTWTGVVDRHERRHAEVAVLRVRTHLPYPFRPGQYALVESPLRPGRWRPTWLASVPGARGEPVSPAGARHHPSSAIVELHVQAQPGDDVGAALVDQTSVGDPLRLRAPGGDTALIEPTGHDLLIVAEGVHIAPVKALLGELAVRGDRRVVHVFWGVPVREDLYDLESVRAYAARCLHATVHPVVARGPAHPYVSGTLPDVVGDWGEWSTHDVYVFGSPVAVRVMCATLARLRVASQRIHGGSLPVLEAMPKQ